MARLPPAPLNALLESLAASAVDVQRILDRGSVPLRVSSFRLATQALIGRGRTTEFSLAATPINLGFRLAYGSREQTESRIEIQVEAVPLAFPE